MQPWSADIGFSSIEEVSSRRPLVKSHPIPRTRSKTGISLVRQQGFPVQARLERGNANSSSKVGKKDKRTWHQQCSSSLHLRISLRTKNASYMLHRSSTYAFEQSARYSFIIRFVFRFQRPDSPHPSTLHWCWLWRKHSKSRRGPGKEYLLHNASLLYITLTFTLCRFELKMVQYGDWIAKVQTEC